MIVVTKVIHVIKINSLTHKMKVHCPSFRSMRKKSPRFIQMIYSFRDQMVSLTYKYGRASQVNETTQWKLDRPTAWQKRRQRNLSLYNEAWRRKSTIIAWQGLKFCNEWNGRPTHLPQWVETMTSTRSFHRQNPLSLELGSGSASERSEQYGSS